MANPLLEARRVIRNKPGGGTLLDGVHLAIDAGDGVAVSGPSGAGKTLLLRALALLDPIDGGEVFWQGQPISCAATPGFRAQVIYLHQRPSLFEGSVEENLRVPFTLAEHRQRTFDRARVVGFLAQFGRDAEFLAKRDRDLSGGETQIVALVRAIQLEPTMLLLDEATSALDRDMVLVAERLVAEWRTAHRAAVWVSHDAAQTERVAQRIIAIDHGRIRE